MSDHRWTVVDAWVLCAVATGGRTPCALPDLIGRADALNHAIPTREELEQALGRLRASLLVEVDGDLRVALTAPGAALAEQRVGGRSAQVGSLHDLLLAHAPLTEARLPLTAEVVGRAYREYAGRRR